MAPGPPWLWLLVAASRGWASVEATEEGSTAFATLDGSIRRKSSSEAMAAVPEGAEPASGPAELRHLIQTDRPQPRPHDAVGTKLAVCILGQLSRLEIDSKVKNLLKPEARRRGENSVHVFVVLDIDSNNFVTANSSVSDADVCTKDYYDPQTVMNSFRPFYAGGFFEKPVNFSRKEENWGIYGTPAKPGITIETRIMYHYRQWTHLDQCMDLVIGKEKRMGEKYQAILKVRDNGIVVSPFVVPHKEKILIKQCFSWWGYNDKVSVVPRQYAEEAFRNSKTLADQVQAGDTATIAQMTKMKVGTAEQYQMFAWRYPRRLPVLQKDDLLPVVDGRCIGKKKDGMRRFCVVPHWKDCHPPNEQENWEVCPGIPQMGHGHER